jgi:hypothetical protein
VIFGRKRVKGTPKHVKCAPGADRTETIVRTYVRICPTCKGMVQTTQMFTGTDPVALECEAQAWVDRVSAIPATCVTCMDVTS